MQKGLHLTAQGVVPPSVRTGVHSLLQQYYYHITNILSSLLPHGFEYQWRLDSGPTDSDPTDLKILDLWLKPKEVVEWLGLTEPTK